MPLSSNDVVFYYTGLGTTVATTLSLGDTISLATIPDDTSGNVFDDVTGDESESGDTEYRGIAVKNTSSTHQYLDVKFWIDGFVRSGATADTISIAKSTWAVDDNQMGSCATESDAPTNDTPSWVEEGEPSNTITWGTIGTENWMPIWLKRVVPAGASAYSDRKCTIKVQGETTASPYTITITKVLDLSWTKNALDVEATTE